MELRHLRYFVAAAEELNITRAALRLGIAQPPLTQQIKALEAELNVRLFERAGRGVILTQTGTIFLETSRQVLESADRAILLARQAGRGELGQLRLGFTSSAAFSPIVTTVIEQYRLRWPKTELVLQEGRTSSLLEGMEQGRLDAAFIRPRDNLPVTIGTRFVSREPMVVAIPISHRLAGRTSVPLRALRDEAFIFYPRSNGDGLGDRVLSACTKAGFTPRITQESPQMTSTINLVAATIGVAIVPACMRHMRPDRVLFLDIRGSDLKAELHLANNSRTSEPTVRNLMSVTRVAQRFV